MIQKSLNLYPEKIDQFLTQEKFARQEKERLREERLLKEQNLIIDNITEKDQGLNNLKIRNKQVG